MEGASAIVRVADDLSLVIDAGRRREYPAGVCRNQRVEILQFATVVNEGMVRRVAIAEQHITFANHHPGGVDCIRDTEVEEDPEVGHLSATIKKRMFGACRGRGVSDDLASIVDSVGTALHSPQGSQVGHLGVAPQEGMFASYSPQ